jgi:LPXTG-motif cell wall-anchored protein
VTLPSNAAPGSYTIIASCTGVLGNGVTRSVAITVAAATTGRLPRTGQSTLPLVAGGVALIAVGAIATVVTRRRRTAA